jgi:hypothetical protein
VVGSCINGAVDVQAVRDFIESGKPRVKSNGKAHARARAEAAERLDKDRASPIPHAYSHL